MKTLIKTLFIALCWIQQVNAQELIAGIGANYEIGKRWNIAGEVQNRNNNNSEMNARSWVFQGKIAYDLFKRVNLSTSYRNTSTKTINYFAENDIENNDKNRYTANITYKSKRLDNEMRFSHRFRYQYSEYEDKNDKEYLRYKFGFDYKLSKNAKPYFAIESYYYLNKSKLKNARLYLGNEFDFNHTKFDVFLITETDPGNDIFALQYLLGVKMKFRINEFI